MNWKRETVEKLKRYRAVAHAVQSIRMELANVEQEAGILSSRRGKLTPKARKERDNRLLDLQMKHGELVRCLDCAQNWVKLTDNGLAQLSEEERSLLIGLYIDLESPRTLYLRKNIDRSSLYRHRNKALKHLTLAMYGMLES